MGSLVSGLIGAFIGAIAGGADTVVASRYFHESDQRRQYRAELLSQRLPLLVSSKADIYSSGSYYATLVGELGRLEAYAKLMSRGEERRARGDKVARTGKEWTWAVSNRRPMCFQLTIYQRSHLGSDTLCRLSGCQGVTSYPTPLTLCGSEKPSCTEA